ncbi:sodium/iodide cotransporter-like [Lytechinus variegatus]|uniref:sodium/iodide cotransporter-like n=1 Tax=Lytechinus variegatus TaxID=7654 RepID=UPI001BB119BC|nr:sodium/iodide cotransporter-like [Lytechinus variegatus]
MDSGTVDSGPRYFGVWDYVIFGFMLLISAAIGLYAAMTGGRQRTNEEFLLGNRQMNIVPVALSVVVSVLSAVSVIGTAAEIYMYDTMYVWVVFTNVIANFFLCRLFLPIFFRLRITSVYEYLERRFNRYVRLCGTVIFTLQTMIFMGIAMYTPALAINAVTGMNMWASILSTGGVCIFYTTLGEMKAVLWTDTLQAIIIFVGVIAFVIKGCIDVGGLGEVWRIAGEGNRLRLFDFRFDPRIRYTVWSMVIGFATLNLGSGITQMSIQRLLACGTRKKAVQAMVLATIIKGVIKALTVLTGIVMYAYYVDCDPLKQGLVSNKDQIMPLMVMDLFVNLPGFPGLFLSTVVSASLSTLSSGINALSAVTAEDGVKSIWPKLRPETYVKITKALGLFYGLVSIGFAFLASALKQGVLQLVMSIVGIGNGCMLGVFTLGIFMHRCNTKGAFAGLLCSYLLLAWIKVGSIFYPSVRGQNALSVEGCPVPNITMTTESNFYTDGTTLDATTTASFTEENDKPALAELYAISFYFYPPIGALTCIIVGMLVSALTGFTDPDSYDHRLKYNFTDALFPCFTESVKEKMRCGAEKILEDEPDEDDDEVKIVKIEKHPDSLDMKEVYTNGGAEGVREKD